MTSFALNLDTLFNSKDIHELIVFGLSFFGCIFNFLTQLKCFFLVQKLQPNNKPAGVKEQS
jgi:hypothetical protein